MNSLVEYKRIKQAVFNKNNLNLKREILKSEEKEYKNKGHIKNKSNKTSENKTCEISNEENKIQIKKNYTSINEDLDIFHIFQNDIKNDKRSIKYEYCYICECAKPCHCKEENYQYEEDISNCYKEKTMSNIHSNFKVISNLMEKIQENKKKKDTKNNKILKNTTKKDECIQKKNNKKEIKGNLGNYEKFYLEKIKITKLKLDNLRNGENGDEELVKGKDIEKKMIFNNQNNIEERLAALKDIEKKHLQLLLDLFEEYVDIEEKIF
ncbi:conserved Plasmodium protein, unknown function [Plasmodium gallinaceum]|uniref:Uncharacterized protein n=1 Tax=Plasmodium gallinaceum TaxID=5849 RepID=A0A1J1GVM8_PLAGA|nr:conserved Plasmodium protein, unknown function [Plasmodium gallinaceum]CRG96509.1 conserved Plasmodium protein, unknown function [Plasmodium gallinaceum]